MKGLTLLPALLVLSCSPSSVNLADVSERNGETYFAINGNKAEFMGIFGQTTSPLMWEVEKQDMIIIEQIIQNAARSKTTNQYDFNHNKLIKVRLTEKETSLLQDISSNAFYRVYAVGTNGKHDKIMEVLYYSSSDSGTMTADIIANITNSSVEIR